MLLSLCVNIACVFVTGCNVAASKYCHCYGINVAVTVYSAPMCCCYFCMCYICVSHCV